VVGLRSNALEVLVDGKSMFVYEDTCIRWAAVEWACGHGSARRNSATFTSRTDGQLRRLRFETADKDARNGGVSGMWRALRRGSAQGAWSLETQGAFTGQQSQRLTFKGGEGEVGIENQSLNRWGMNFVKGKRYEGHVWLRGVEPTRVFLALESAEGSKVYAETHVEAKSADWQRSLSSSRPTRMTRAAASRSN
jgi:hypothetical protein